MAFYILLKLLFMALITVLDLVSRAVFAAVAGLLVLAVHALKLPGQAMQGALEQIADGIRGCFESLFGLLYEALSALLSSFFDVLVETASEALFGTGSAVQGLAEKAVASLGDYLAKELPELVEGLSEMMGTVAGNLWNNYKEALSHFMENA